MFSLIKDFSGFHTLSPFLTFFILVLKTPVTHPQPFLDLLDLLAKEHEELFQKLFIKLQQANVLTPTQHITYFLMFPPLKFLPLRLISAKLLIQEHQKITPKEEVYQALLTLLKALENEGLDEKTEEIFLFLKKTEPYNVKALQIFSRSNHPLFEKHIKTVSTKTEEGKKIKEELSFKIFQKTKREDFEGAYSLGKKIERRYLPLKENLELDLYFLEIAKNLNDLTHSPEGAEYFLTLTAFRKEKTPKLFLKLTEIAKTPSQKEELKKLFKDSFPKYVSLLTEKTVFNLFKNALHELVQDPIPPSLFTLILKNPSEKLVEALQTALKTLNWSDDLKETLRTHLGRWILLIKHLDDLTYLNIAFQIHLLNIPINDPSLEEVLIRQAQIEKNKVHELAKTIEKPSLPLIESLLEQNCFRIFWLKRKAKSHELTKEIAVDLVYELKKENEFDLCFELIEKFEIDDETLLLELLPHKNKSLPLLMSLFPRGPSTHLAISFANQLIKTDDPLMALLWVKKNKAAKIDALFKTHLLFELKKSTLPLKTLSIIMREALIEEEEILNELLRHHIAHFSDTPLPQNESLLNDILNLIKKTKTFPFPFLKHREKIKSQKALLELYQLVKELQIPENDLSDFILFIKQVVPYLNTEEKLVLVEKYKETFSKEMLEKIATDEILSLLKKRGVKTADLLPFIKLINREKAHENLALRALIHTFLEDFPELENAIVAIAEHLNLFTELNFPLSKMLFPQLEKNYPTGGNVTFKEDPLLHLYCFWLEEVIEDVEKFPLIITLGDGLILASQKEPSLEKKLFKLIERIISLKVEHVKQFVKMKFAFLDKPSTKAFLKTEQQNSDVVDGKGLKTTKELLQQVKSSLKAANGEKILELLDSLTKISFSLTTNEKQQIIQISITTIETAELYFLTSKNNGFYYEMMGEIITKIGRFIQDKNHEIILYYFEKLATLLITYHDNCLTFAWEKQELLTPYLNMCSKMLKENDLNLKKDLFLRKTIDKIYLYFSQFCLKNKTKIGTYEYFYPKFYLLIKEHTLPNRIIEQMAADRIKMQS